MAQLTIYIDDDTLAKIEKSAKQERGSISSWVKKRLTGSLAGSWPAGYFDVFGSLKNTGFARPVQPDQKSDRKRESL
jgi:hypothetical protein